MVPTTLQLPSTEYACIRSNFSSLAGFIWQRVGDRLLKECTKEHDSADMDNIVTVDTSGEWNACKNDAGSCTEEQFSTIQGRIYGYLTVLSCQMLYGETQQLSTSSHPGIHLADYRTKLLEALKPVEDSQKDGMFIDGCFHHCQASRTVFWNGPQAPRINNKTASEALGDWYFERLTATDAAIDCRYPCNPACGFFNRSPGEPSFRKWSRT
ncbi:unnamed protein product [Sphagnum jensenii]|uniref:Pectin acetylesterase n=1 Tax=Sphagnum jensenii TaxID=128206 RepID=A0ABP0VPS7_9BRYO